MARRRGFAAGTIAALVGASLIGGPAGAQSGPVKISYAYGGGDADGRSYSAVPSRNGRYVTFSSEGENLVNGSDSNGTWDAFLLDRDTDTVTRVSKDSNGDQGNDASWAWGVSNDGAVLFDSYADNLVSGDNNGVTDLFVRESGVTERVSVTSNGNEANGDSWPASLSSNGDRVAFLSTATNLGSSNPGGLYLHDRSSGQTSLLVDGNDSPSEAMISGDGDSVVFVTPTAFDNSDNNGSIDVYVHDVSTSTNELVVASPVDSSQPYISQTGRYVAFVSNGVTNDDLTLTKDVFVRDMVNQTTHLVSVASDETQGDEGSAWPSVSEDGRYVAFESYASNLVAGDTNGFGTDVFVRDRTNGTTARLNEPSSGAEPNSDSTLPVVAQSGGFAVFSSYASNLVGSDGNGDSDVFEAQL